jgi:MFS family permease
MSFYQAIRNFSIAAGPVLGGVLANFLGFRSIFIFLLVLSSITVLAITVFLPETLRSIAGDGSLRLTGIHQPLIRRFRKRPDNLEDRDESYVRPPVALRTFFEPLLLLKRKEILLNLIFGGVIYAIWSMVTSSTTTLFKQLFHLDELKLGFAFVPNGKFDPIFLPFKSVFFTDLGHRVRNHCRERRDGPSDESLLQASRR